MRLSFAVRFTRTDRTLPSQSNLKTVFGWNIVINLYIPNPSHPEPALTPTDRFYIPGTMGGALIVDRVKPKRLMILMLLTQAVVGFIMSGLYVQLSGHSALTSSLPPHPSLTSS